MTERNQNSPEVEIGKWYPCRDQSWEGQVLKTGLPGVFTIAGLVRNKADHKLWWCDSWTKEGRTQPDKKPHDCDLVLEQPEPNPPSVEIGRWYPCRGGRCEGKVLEIGLPGDYTMAGIIRTIEEPSDWWPDSWTKDGRNTVAAKSYELDLVLPTQPNRYRVTEWATCHILEDGTAVIGGTYCTKSSAKV